MFISTKILELGSCAFRQPKASHSHCRFIHGYKLSAKFWFQAKELDINNWVVDFGGLKGLKAILREQFDHTTCIAADDPVLPVFQELMKLDACDLRIMPNGTGIERIAEWCYNAANRFVTDVTDNRCKCIKVEAFEHENNSAIYAPGEEPSEEEKSINQMKRSKVDKEIIETEEKVSEPEKKKTVSKDLSISTNTTKQVNTWVDPSAPKNSWRF